MYHFYSNFSLHASVCPALFLIYNIQYTFGLNTLQHFLIGSLFFALFLRYLCTVNRETHTHTHTEVLSLVHLIPKKMNDNWFPALRCAALTERQIPFILNPAKLCNINQPLLWILLHITLHTDDLENEKEKRKDKKLN